VFLKECEFDNTDIKGTLSIDWRHVSVKAGLYPINHNFLSFYSQNSAGIKAIVYSYVAFIKNRNI
jgi:hypothetical protein